MLAGGLAWIYSVSRSSGHHSLRFLTPGEVRWKPDPQEQLGGESRLYKRREMEWPTPAPWANMAASPIVGGPCGAWSPRNRGVVLCSCFVWACSHLHWLLWLHLWVSLCLSRFILVTTYHPFYPAESRSYSRDAEFNPYESDALGVFPRAFGKWRSWNCGQC